MGRRTLLLITSILVAAVGTALIGLYVKGANDRAVGQQTLRSALVASTDIPAGTKITGQYLAVRQWRSTDLPPDYVVNAAQLIGKTASGAIFDGQPLQSRMFTSSAEGTDHGIQKDQVGVTVELSDPQRAAGLLSVGSKITIFSQPKLSSGKSQSVALLSKVVVIQIGNDRQGSDQSSQTGSAAATAEDVPTAVVGLTLSPGDAMKVKDAEANGTLYFGVLPAGSGS
jgi:pilus assembly protein CpaB